MIQIVYLLKKIIVELFECKIPVFFKVVEDTFFQDTDSIFNTALVFGFPYFSRKNNCMVMISPFSIVFVKIRINPVFIGDYSLFTVVTYNNGRNSSEVTECVIVCFDPLWSCLFTASGHGHGFAG